MYLFYNVYRYYCYLNLVDKVPSLNFNVMLYINNSPGNLLPENNLN